MKRLRPTQLRTPPAGYTWKQLDRHAVSHSQRDDPTTSYTACMRQQSKGAKMTAYMSTIPARHLRWSDLTIHSPHASELSGANVHNSGFATVTRESVPMAPINAIQSRAHCNPRNGCPTNPTANTKTREHTTRNKMEALGKATGGSGTHLGRDTPLALASLGPHTTQTRTAY